METGVSVKAGIAFLAGVVLALGGAFTYFRVTDARSHPMVLSTTAPADNKQPVPDLSVSPKADPVSSPVEQPPATAAVPDNQSTVKAEDRVRVIPAHAVRAKQLLPKPKVTSRPVSLAVANPPAIYQAPVAPTPSSAAPTDLPVPQAAPPPLPTPQPVQAPAPQPAAPQAHTVTIPAGTNLSVRLNEKLSTDHNYSGDTFRASLDAPIVVDGFIIADRGAKVLGRIVKADKAGKMSGAAEIGLTLTEISTTDGQKMQIETNQSLRKGSSNNTQSAEKIGGGAALGAIIGAIAGGGKGAAIGAGAGGAAGTGAVFLGHGKAAVIDNETRLTFQLTSPTTLTEKLQ